MNMYFSWTAAAQQELAWGPKTRIAAQQKKKELRQKYEELQKIVKEFKFNCWQVTTAARKTRWIKRGAQTQT